MLTSKFGASGSLLGGRRDTGTDFSPDVLGFPLRF